VDVEKQNATSIYIFHVAIFVGLPAVPQDFRTYEPTAEHLLLPTSAHS
jgi:hypothetical protein